MHYRLSGVSAAVVILLAGCDAKLPTPSGPETDLTGPAASSEQGNAYGAIIRTTAIGNPAWRVAGFRVFSAPIGKPFDDGFAELIHTIFEILPPPFYLPHPQLTAGPGQPHSPPYDLDLANGVAAKHYKLGPTFVAEDMTGTNAIWVGWMTVPRGEARGSSPDFAYGPIIPNSLFPIVTDFSFSRDGKPFDVFQGSQPALNDPSLTPSFSVDGTSHYPYFSVESDVLTPQDNVVGLYTGTIIALDRTGKGWKIEMRWRVVGKD